MMDTVLDVGLNDSSVEGLAKQSGDERFAWDSYRRLVQMFAKTVMGVDGGLFEQALTGPEAGEAAATDTELEVDDLEKLVSIYKDIVTKKRADLPRFASPPVRPGHRGCFQFVEW